MGASVVEAQVALSVRDLVKKYPKPGGGTLAAVDGVSFDVSRGEVFGFLGPNGAGKTTTLEIVEGIRKATSGQVRVLGVDPRRDLDRVKEVIGVQLQAASYFSLLTLQELLALFGSFYPRRREPGEPLEIVGLTEMRKAYVRQLSGGQQHRFSVAAALVNDPEVIFLDEPTTGLDPQMRHTLWDLIRRLNRDEGKTVVLTTHYIEEAELLADRVAIVDHGRLQAIDTPRALIARLDGSGSIRFATSDPVEDSQLGRFGEVVRSSGEASGVGLSSYELRVARPREAVPAILDWSARAGVELRALEVRPGTLEDVFLHLTGRALRE